jgi:hypothetical protein
MRRTTRGTSSPITYPPKLRNANGLSGVVYKRGNAGLPLILDAALMRLKRAGAKSMQCSALGRKGAEPIRVGERNN